jgi:hypothetical protein
MLFITDYRLQVEYTIRVTLLLLMYLFCFFVCVCFVYVRVCVLCTRFRVTPFNFRHMNNPHYHCAHKYTPTFITT